MAVENEDIRVHERWSYGLAHAVLIYLVALLLTIPAFMVTYPLVPELILPIGDGIKIDHFLTFVFWVGIFIIVVRKLQLWIYGFLVALMLVITVTGLTGKYGFGDLYHDYASFVQLLYERSNGGSMAAERLATFQDSETLLKAMDTMHPSVRNYAVESATMNFSGVATSEEEQVLIHSFSVFKEINSHWKYVADPEGVEYIAKASETVEHLSGDCDDHAVLMASAIRAVGGKVRLVRTKAHIYPELFIGDEQAMERAADLIRNELFKQTAHNESLFHHTDADGSIWLNLDYTKKYPGGELMDEQIVGILENVE